MPIPSVSVRMGARHSRVVLDDAPDSADALYQFFERLSPEPDAAFAMVLPPNREASRVTAAELSRRTSLPVTTVTEPTSLSFNQVYLSPPGQSLVLRWDELVPTDWEETAADPSVPMIHIIRGPDRGRRQWATEGEGIEERSGRLSLHPSPSIYDGADVPLVLVDRAPVWPAVGASEAGTRDESRPERLERELRKTQRELGDMVQKYEETRRRLQATHEALQEKNKRLEERTEQVRTLSQAVTRAEENERERLSRVLHDELQQVLYAVRTKADLVADRGNVTDRGRELLSQAIDLLEDGIETTRTLASDLNPPVEESLWDTLEWLTIQMQEAHGLSVEMRASGRDRPTNESLRILVVRVVQELLFNVVKHAGTNEVLLSVEEAEDRLHVMVEDDGVGFEPDDFEEKTDEFGLTNVRRRIEVVGGNVEINAAPGEGTQVRLAVPFQINEEEDE